MPTNKTIELSQETLTSIAEALGIAQSVNINSIESENTPFLGRRCVVRTDTAGVHIGTVVAKNGSNVILSDAVRLWRWEGAFSLSEVATVGVGKASRISMIVPLIELTGAVEIIGTSASACKTFTPRNN